MSDADGKDPEFDEFDLPEGDLNLPDGDLGLPDAPDETSEFAAPGDGLEPADDLLEPGDDSSGSGPGDETAPPEQDGDLVDAEIGDTSDVDEGGDEEPPEEEAEEKEKKKKKGPSFLEKLRSTSPYVVLLGISLLAIIIGIMCLLMELGRYGGQIKPTQARVAPAVQLGPLTTTAAT
ncbi:hypothetical protein ACFL5Q_02575 [Planctomycetota bacterium]